MYTSALLFIVIVISFIWMWYAIDTVASLWAASISTALFVGSIVLLVFSFSQGAFGPTEESELRRMQDRRVSPESVSVLNDIERAMTNNPSDWDSESADHSYYQLLCADARRFRTVETYALQLDVHSVSSDVLDDWRVFDPRWSFVENPFWNPLTSPEIRDASRTGRGEHQDIFHLVDAILSHDVDQVESVLSVNSYANEHASKQITQDQRIARNQLRQAVFGTMSALSKAETVADGALDVYGLCSA